MRNYHGLFSINVARRKGYDSANRRRTKSWSIVLKEYWPRWHAIWQELHSNDNQLLDATDKNNKLFSFSNVKNIWIFFRNKFYCKYYLISFYQQNRRLYLVSVNRTGNPNAINIFNEFLNEYARQMGRLSDRKFPSHIICSPKNSRDLIKDDFRDICSHVQMLTIVKGVLRMKIILEWCGTRSIQLF